MASQPQPQPGQAQGQEQGGKEDPLNDFRELAQKVQMIGQKYPEAAQDAAGMLKAIQAMMTKVAGNSQRTPEKQAPPMA